MFALMSLPTNTVTDSATPGSDIRRRSDQGEREIAGGGAAKPRIASRRRALHLPDRPTVFVEPGELDAALDGRGRRVFVVGPVPRARQMIADFPNAGASENRLYLDGHYPVIRRGGDRATWANQYFGDRPFTISDAGAVWRELDRMLSIAWRWNGSLLSLTPATTGRDLWVRTIPAGDGYPVLDERLQATIRAGSGQGRIEVMPGAGSVTLHEYDARLAYLSLTRRMPVGEPVDLHGADAEQWIEEHPYAPCRALVSFYVPDGWGRRPGILPIALDRADNPDAGWHWPTGPGTLHGPTWCEGSELALARRYAWRTTVHRVIGWTDTADVFAIWQTRLLKVLDQGARLYRGDELRGSMFRSAVRAIALHTIGSLNGAPHKVTHIGTSPSDGALSIRALGPGLLTWHTIEPPAWPQLSHPEWTATIWGRARTRLLDAPGKGGHRVGALHVEPGAVVAFRTDAIYTDRPLDWDRHDDGAPGRYRHKGSHGPVPWPRNGTDVLAAKGDR